MLSLKNTLTTLAPLGWRSRSALRRKKIVILGAGWAGYRIARSIDRVKFDVTLLSPRNYFLFTPLLAPTTVGTLEFRCITEPIRTIPDLNYHQSWCTGIDTVNQKLTCQDFFQEDVMFDVPYDTLIMACGAQANTFGIKGVSEFCHFLKHLGDARGIRNRILECFERADTPGLDPKVRERLLTFVIVGGGPTSVEFAAELHDFLIQDVVKFFPRLEDSISVYLVEATEHILGTFSPNLAEYTERLYRSRNVKLLLGTSVKEVEKEQLTLSDGTVIPYGIVVWSTGNAPNQLVQSLDWAKDPKSGRLLIDDHCAAYGPGGTRDKTLKHVFAVGDCAVNPENPLPPTAQVAEQMGKYMAKLLTKTSAEPDGTLQQPPFKYSHRGLLAYIGDRKALADTESFMMKGGAGWFIWNSAYLSQLVSIKNRILVPMHWFKSFLFGRDISQF